MSEKQKRRHLAPFFGIETLMPAVAFYLILRLLCLEDRTPPPILSAVGIPYDKTVSTPPHETLMQSG